MPPQRGPRGEKVTVVAYIPHDGEIEDLAIEAFAAAGVRPSSHKSAQDRVQELMDEEVAHVRTFTVKVE